MVKGLETNSIARSSLFSGMQKWNIFKREYRILSYLEHLLYKWHVISSENYGGNYMHDVETAVKAGQKFTRTGVASLDPDDRVIRLPEVERLTSLKRKSLYTLMDYGDFPKQFPLAKRCVGWSLKEVLAWIEGRKQARGH